MATTEVGAQLTEGHRRSQVDNLRPVLRQFERSWSADVVATSADFVAFVNDMTPEVLDGYNASERATRRYYRAFRSAEGVAGTVPNIRMDGPRASVVTENLERFGPGYVMSLVEDQGLTDSQATNRALTQMVLTTTREVLSGSRDTFQAHVEEDAQALGYQRVAAGDACAFCAMLASRGPVYGSRSVSGRNRQWHRGCRCSVEAVYTDRTSLPDNSERYRELWDETGNLNAFRRRLERPHLHE